MTVKDKTSKRTAHKKLIVPSAAAAVLLLSVLAWMIVRCTATADCTPWTGAAADGYGESDRVFAAMSLSYLVYGCEGCDGADGTAAHILDTQKMGIIIENADITRTDKADPSTALIDSAAFIRQSVGEYRFLTELKNPDSSFYGAAFADDEHRTVWIAYAGSVSFTDALQSSLLVLGAGLSAQEACAFELYESVLKTDEIRSGYAMMLTGHSLGGALATMVARMSGAEAVTISGADGLAMRKINGIAGGRPNSCRITNYLTAPDGVSLRDTVQRMMLWGDNGDIVCHTYECNAMVDNTHCVFGFVRFEDGDPARPVLPEEIPQT